MKIQYVIYVLVVFLFASCSNGGEDENRGAAYGKVNVALSVTLPEPETYIRLPVLTRTARSRMWTCLCLMRRVSSWSG